MDYGNKVLSVNRKASYNYDIEDTIECGLVLKGTEVKSLKQGKFSFSDAYGKIDRRELWLIGLHITPYRFGNIHNHDPDRQRKLLVHKKELKRLKRKVVEKGLTLIPIKVYLKKGLVKVELGICRGKKIIDKREEIKRRDIKRETERALRQKY